MFGNVESLKEECRDARRTAFVEHLRRDTRHAVRRLLRDWRFTTAAVLILGLGIGANTAIFSVVNATLFRESQFANPDRLVDIYQNGRDGAPLINTYTAYLDMAEYTNVFARTAAVSVPNPSTYLDRGVLRNGMVEFTSPTYPAVLGLNTFSRALVRRHAGSTRHRHGCRHQPSVLADAFRWRSVDRRSDDPDARRPGHDHRRRAGRLQCDD